MTLGMIVCVCVFSFSSEVKRGGGRYKCFDLHRHYILLCPGGDGYSHVLDVMDGFGRNLYTHTHTHPPVVISLAFPIKPIITLRVCVSTPTDD